MSGASWVAAWIDVGGFWGGPPPPGRISEGGGPLWSRLSADCAPLWCLDRHWRPLGGYTLLLGGFLRRVGAFFLRLSVYTLGGSEGILRGVGASVARFRHLGGLLQRSHFPYSFLYRSAIFGGRRLCGQISASGGPSPEEPFSLHISLQIGHFGARRLCGQISASGRPSPEEPLSLQLSLQIGHFRARRLCGQIWLNAYFHPCTTRCETVASALVSAVEQSVLA